MLEYHEKCTCVVLNILGILSLKFPCLNQILKLRKTNRKTSRDTSRKNSWKTDKKASRKAGRKVGRGKHEVGN